jgi:hypothetical protein
MMVGSTVGKPGVWMASRLAYAAGVTGTLANFSLIAFSPFGSAAWEVGLRTRRDRPYHPE